MDAMTGNVAVQLATERLRLRPPVLEDAPAAAELVGDPEVMRFLGGEVVPPAHVGEVVAAWIRRWQENGMGPFVIERRDDGRFLGRAGILVWDTRTWTHATFAGAGRFAQPELGWALVRAEWGKGYATEGAAAVRDWVRGSRRGGGRLVSVIAAANSASQRVAERLGATPAETVRLFDSGDAVIWVHPNERPREHHPQLEHVHRDDDEPREHRRVEATLDDAEERLHPRVEGTPRRPRSPRSAPGRRRDRGRRRSR